jgi:hypothetical protein
MKNILIVSGLLSGLVVLVLMAPLPANAAAPTTAWVKHYRNLANGQDGASALKVDAAGNVYVNGRSQGNGTGYDYATIKYSPSGAQLWVARYDGPAHKDDEPVALAVDKQGNVYVTGWSMGSSTKKDFATVKYDSNGKQLWVKRYDGPAHGDDAPVGRKSLAVDDWGNVYVTGYSIRSDPFTDYATIKYSPSGQELWVKRYNDPTALLPNAWPYALAVDGAGNVYVTGGASGPPSEGLRFATIKYDTNGKELWTSIYSGSDSENGTASDLAVDVYGNVYVTGISVGSDLTGITDYATIKYDSKGKQLWAQRYDGPGHWGDEAFAIAVDALGYVSVTGFSDGVGGSYGSGNKFWDYATVQYSPSGKQLWVARYDGPAHAYDAPLDLALDKLGNVYVTGASRGLAGTTEVFDYATLKYNAAGGQVWLQRYRSPANLNSSATAVAVDDKGNVYVTGGSADSATAGSFTTIKYSQGGPQPAAGKDLSGMFLLLLLDK